MKTNCRVCLSSDLKTFVGFGDLYMTGHFPIAALVLPWHFRESIAQKMSQSSGHDSKLIFPLPQIPTVVSYQ